MNNNLLAFSRKSVSHLFGIVGIRNNDVLLASFPRSGNTWMRFLLCNLISLCEWDGKRVDFPLLNKTMPEFGVNNLLDEWSHATIPRVIKTHKSFLPIFRNKRSVGIIRDPRDVMVSYYHYMKDRYQINTSTFCEFIRDPRTGLENWFKHYISWCDHWTIIVKYESMKDNQLAVLIRVLDLLSVRLTESVILEAIERSNTRNIKSVDRSYVGIPKRDAQFVRNGQTRQWITYFEKDDLSYYYDLAEKYGVYNYVDKG